MLDQLGTLVHQSLVWVDPGEPPRYRLLESTRLYAREQLVAHGARDPRWAEPFVRIQTAIRARRPGLAVELAFLELMQPSLTAVISALVSAGHRRRSEEHTSELQSH